MWVSTGACRVYLSRGTPKPTRGTLRSGLGFIVRLKVRVGVRLRVRARVNVRVRIRIRFRRDRDEMSWQR